jgi:hypothetical protein
MESKVIGGIVVVGVFGFVGFLVKEWTGWTSSTLIDLNSRTAVMESEIKHTNDMVAKNYEMLKFLVNKTQKASFNDQSRTNDLPSIQISTGGE